MTDSHSNRGIRKGAGHFGEHEVERYAYSRSSGEKGASTNKSLRTDRERVVMPSQITG